MGENLEVVATHQRHKRHAGLVGRANGKRRRRGNRYKDGTAYNRRLLHHLDRQAAGDGDHPFRALMARPNDRAAELVESIVPSDILARGKQTLGRDIEARAMHGTRLAMQRLRIIKQCDRADDVLLREL